jgi:hypothetical protein
MARIKILFYTDSFINRDPDPDLKTWGLSELEKFVVYKLRAFATFEFDLANRHLGNKQRLERKLLCQYDEVWIFGLVNNEGAPFELDDEEVAALKNWMDQGGGLFITGDHSVPYDSQFCGGDHTRFFNLGYSLGNRIKRAGEMRLWKGPPTACADSLDNFNTQESSGTGSLEDPNLDKDNIAQTLFELPDPPHPLFWWKIDHTGKIIPIQKFPDHGHEGKLLKPDVSGKEWPSGASEAVVAARGLDKRFLDKSRIYDLVLAFDGDSSGVGRIVADSSFHHYVNINLRNLPSRKCTNYGCGYPEPDSDLDQIAQYYGNLALWLAPKSVRQNLKFELLLRTAEHPEIFEVQGTSLPYLGKMARQIMILEAGDISNLYRLVAPAASEAKSEPFNDIFQLLFLAKNSFLELSAGEHQIVLGSILRIYQSLTLPIKSVEVSLHERRPLLRSAINAGFKLAIETVPQLGERLARMDPVV